MPTAWAQKQWCHAWVTGIAHNGDAKKKYQRCLSLSPLQSVCSSHHATSWWVSVLWFRQGGCWGLLWRSGTDEMINMWAMMWALKWELHAFLSFEHFTKPTCKSGSSSRRGGGCLRGAGIFVIFVSWLGAKKSCLKSHIVFDVHECALRRKNIQPMLRECTGAFCCHAPPLKKCRYNFFFLISDTKQHQTLLFGFSAQFQCSKEDVKKVSYWCTGRLVHRQPFIFHFQFS